MVCLANTRQKTVYKWLEKKLRRMFASVVPEHFSLSSFGSPGHSKISSNQNSSVMHHSMVVPTESFSKEPTTVRRALAPVCEAVYLPGDEVGEGGLLDEKVLYEVKLKGNTGDKNNEEVVGAVEMKLQFQQQQD